MKEHASKPIRTDWYITTDTKEAAGRILDRLKGQLPRNQRVRVEKINETEFEIFIDTY